MTINTYTTGALVRCACRFEDINGNPYDPAVVAFQVRAPGSVSATTHTYGADAAVVRDSVGIYHDDVSAETPGRWHYRWQGTGSGQAADEHEFHVESSRFD